jgi:hypothetical protein
MKKSKKSNEKCWWCDEPVLLRHKCKDCEEVHMTCQRHWFFIHSCKDAEEEELAATMKKYTKGKRKHEAQANIYSQ